MTNAGPELAPGRSADDRLDSWKEIAAHLRRGERTVRRWEQTEGLPVYRHAHQKQATVYAFRSELSAWLENRGNHLESPHRATAIPGGDASKRRRVLLTAIASLLVGAGAVAAIAWFPGRDLGGRQKGAVTVTPLTSFSGSENYPAFSPDGKLVAFSWAHEDGGKYDIYILPIGSENPRRLTQDPAQHVGPAWSPDGRWIAFLRLAGSQGEVILTPAAGGAERRITGVRAPSISGPQFGGWLAWSPDGKWLVASDTPSPSEPAGLFLISPETGEKRRLTSHGWGDLAPAFSPDGRSLAFVRVLGFAVSDVFVLPFGEGYYPAGEPKQITFNRKFAASPGWSRDGKSILFSSGELWGSKKLCQVAASGSDGRPARQVSLPVDLEEGSTFAVSFRGAGMGGRLVYQKPLFDPNIWMVELDGADGKPGPARKVISSTRIDFFPQFSPDGKWIAFASTRSGQQEIWLSNRDGSQLRQLTDFKDHRAGTPRWSPDGRWIVFDASPEGRGGIYVISAAGGVPRRIVKGVIPSWSRDGRWIYFSSKRSGQNQIYKIAVTAPFTTTMSDPVQVTENGGIAAFESTEGELVYYRGRSIWTIPAGGGEQELLKNVNGWSNFAVAGQGIFFATQTDPASGHAIRLYRFSTGEIRTVAKIEKPIFPGLSASDDGRSILYSQVDREESDLMLVENLP